MKVFRIIVILIAATIFTSILSGCGSKKRVLVIDCPSEKPSEYNKTGFKNEKEREKTLDRRNRFRKKERK